MAAGNTYDVTAPEEEAQALSQVVLHNGNDDPIPGRERH